MEGVMFTAREKEILRKMDAHHREGGTSPFIARAQGKLSQVAEEMKVPVDKLDQFLDTLNRSVLPTDYLMG